MIQFHQFYSDCMNILLMKQALKQFEVILDSSPFYTSASSIVMVSEGQSDWMVRVIALLSDWFSGSHTLCNPTLLELYTEIQR